LLARQLRYNDGWKRSMRMRRSAYPNEVHNKPKSTGDQDLLCSRKRTLRGTVCMSVKDERYRFGGALQS